MPRVFKARRPRGRPDVGSLARDMEKSEGELSDSEEEEEAKPPLPKKAKKEPPVRNEAGCNDVDPKGTSRKSRARVRKKMKKKEKKIAKREHTEQTQGKQEQARQKQVVVGLVKQEQAVRELAREEGRLVKLNIRGPPSSDYRAILTQLTTLLPSSSSFTNSTTAVDLLPQATGDTEYTLPLFKTAALQAAILHLLLGDDDTSPDPRLAELRSHGVAVLWLSMVSAETFLSRPDLFSGLGSLSPSVQLLLNHPGTESSAKLGLEAFLFKSPETEEGGGGEVGRKGLTKPRCLLSMVDMNANEFPLPHELQTEENIQNTSDYVSLCGDWCPGQTLPDSCNMFAMDCEMVITKDGYELARVSVVDEKLACVYDKLVKPDNPVLDYKTEFSGITQEILRNVTTSLSEVQKDLSTLLPQRCILIGHSLENDFRALKMTHPFVIDTSCLFQGPPETVTNWFKPKLRLLAKRFLGKEIQTGNDGHSPTEDAQACMELVLKKLKLGDRMSLHKTDRSILSEVASRGRPTAIVDRSSIVRLFGGLASHYTVSRDEEVLEEGRDAVSSHHLTFLQLHSYEDLIRGKANCPPEHSRDRVLRQLDSEATDILASLPPGTLALVVCGSNDITRMKSLVRLKLRDKVKELVATARTGLALTFIT